MGVVERLETGDMGVVQELEIGGRRGSSART